MSGTKSTLMDGTITDVDNLNTSSAANSGCTTQTSSPRPFCDGSDLMNSTPAKWEQVRDVLVDSALEGNQILHRYGDMITSRETIERFLAGAKGNIEKAADQLQTHLEWRHDYMLDGIVDEDFSDLEAQREIYWGGCDLQGVPTLTWLIGKHVPSNQCPKRFVRFFVYQIEKGLRRSSKYPNAMFNIFVELSDAGLHSIDSSVAALLQPILMKNYPKVRKGMFVFPVNWFVQLCWNTVLKPLISSLQPDIEDKICPLYGDYRPQLFARFSQDQVELAFGGTLDLANTPPPAIIPYRSKDLGTILDMERQKREANFAALQTTQQLASEKLVLLQTEAKEQVARRRRRSHQQRVVADTAASTPSIVEESPRARSKVLHYLVLAMLFVTFWTGANFWTLSGLCLVMSIYLLQKGNVEAADGGWSRVEAVGWAKECLSERDSGVIVERLEQQRAAIPSPPSSLTHKLFSLFSDYARRCGI